MVRQRNMNVTLLVVFIGFIHLDVSNAQSRWRQFRKHTESQANLPVAGFRERTSVRNVGDCLSKCTMDSYCVSLFFVEANSLCQTHGELVADTVGLDAMHTAVYYTKIYPAFTCPVDNTIFRTVRLADNSAFTYKYYKTGVSRTVAANSCAADGAYLVRLTSSAKMDVLQQLIYNCPGYSYTVWIDLTNINAVDFSDVTQWVSSLGIPLPVGNDFWHSGQPKEAFERHCGTLWEGEVDDTFCHLSKYFICEKDTPI